MATTTLLQHPRHDQHPLEYLNFIEGSDFLPCLLCYRKKLADGYACLKCMFYAHRECAEAPSQIDRHPLHPDHPLTIIHRPSPFRCDACGEGFTTRSVTTFRCDECDFDLDIRCALSTLSDPGGSQGKIPEPIMLPLHPHKLTSFSTRHDFIGDSNCVICKASVEGNGYACLTGSCQFIIHKRCVQDLFGDEYDLNVDISCASSTLLDRGGSEGKTPKWIALSLHHHLLTSFSKKYDIVKASGCVMCKSGIIRDGYECLHWQCDFLIHKRCVGDPYYTDGTKAPQFYHRHPHETFLGEDTVLRSCAKCGSKASSGEFIGCASCQVFYCKECIQVPEIIQYPHHPDHTLVLLINSNDNYRRECDSCLSSCNGELCYGCPSCDYFVDLRCALRVLAYREEVMSAEIELSWHKHPLLLCHGIGYELGCCSYCEDESAGPMYACKDLDCNVQLGCKDQDFNVLLHKRCTEIESTIIHPHHPDHSLTLCDRGDFQSCGACSDTIHYLKFSCKLCAFYLHPKCAAHVPTRKHSLHEHELLHLEKALSWECNRCGTNLSSPFFRCVPCNFNLHEECMELPLQVSNSEIHWHPLTLHETYVEDDSGEYYCDRCEKMRDDRMGVYVCLHCSARWAYHIECIFTELRKVCVRERNAAEIERLARDITEREEEVREVGRKLEEMNRELDEQRKKYAELTEQ